MELTGKNLDCDNIQNSRKTALLEKLYQCQEQCVMLLTNLSIHTSTCNYCWLGWIEFKTEDIIGSFQEELRQKKLIDQYVITDLTFTQVTMLNSILLTIVDNVGSTSLFRTTLFNAVRFFLQCRSTRFSFRSKRPSLQRPDYINTNACLYTVLLQDGSLKTSSLTLNHKIAKCFHIFLIISVSPTTI